jgi:hypothetical protein
MTWEQRTWQAIVQVSLLQNQHCWQQQPWPLGFGFWQNSKGLPNPLTLKSCGGA